MTNKVGMISLGCPKNQVDGEVMLEKLNKSGFEIAQNIEDSDVMIINTCGFIEDAKREAIETILEVAEYIKSRNHKCYCCYRMPCRKISG